MQNASPSFTIDPFPGKEGNYQANVSVAFAAAVPLKPGQPDLLAFMRENNRAPMLGDAVAPWRYKGWMLWQVIFGHILHPDVPNRWGYWLEFLDTGKLPDHPIPRMKFHNEGNATYLGWRRTLEKLGSLVRLIEQSGRGWSAFGDVVGWLSFSLGIEDEIPAGLDDSVLEQLYRTFDISWFLLSPADYLGQFLSENMSRHNPTQFFPTPFAVVECMIEMQMHDAVQEGKDTRILTVYDPCVGTGRFLLGASNYSLRLYGTDIDPQVIAVTKINGAFFCPWMTWPFPESLFQHSAETNITN